jgi:hypothetical protein
MLDGFRSDFGQNSSTKTSQNAVTQTTIDGTALVYDIVQGTDSSFSTQLSSLLTRS